MPPLLAPSRVPWLVGGVLVLLVAALAGLQLRWLDQVEQADRQRLEAAAETALAAFAADVDREVSRAWLTFLPAAHGIPHRRPGPEELRERWLETAPIPELVREVVQVDAPPRSPGRPGSFAGHGPELLPGLPGFQAPAGAPWRLRGRGRREDEARWALRVAFDRELIADSFLPELVRRHLVPVLGPDVHARVTVAATGVPVFATGPGISGPFEWRAPLFDLLPPDELRRLAFATGIGRGAVEDPALPEEPDGGGPRVGRPDLALRSRHLARVAALLDPPAGWLLEVRPAEGSLDAALGLARRGNAGMVFGLLGLLGVAALALAVYARRAQEMAHRQVEFTAAVSHELRTPIAAIRSLAENLADGLVHGPEQARLYGEELGRQGARLTDMVEQVLALAAGHAARRPPDPTPVELEAVVRDAVAGILAAAPAVAVAVEAAPDVPPVIGDRQTIERAVANLVGNAVKHGGDGVRVRVLGAADGREAAVEVSDRGLGVPAGERARLFEPFFRGQVARSRQLPGSGLGLHLVRTIADAHGGRVEVAAAPGGGSTFTLVLPARPEARPADGAGEGAGG